MEWTEVHPFQGMGELAAGSVVEGHYDVYCISVPYPKLGRAENTE